MDDQVAKQKVGRNDPLLTVYDGEMTNQIKSIIIVGVVIIVLYYIMSPYQNCVRNEIDEDLCLSKTIW
jgi:hypothetical protein